MCPGPRIQRLDPDECIRLLAGSDIGRVALTMSALPAIRTVRYALVPGHVVFRAAPGSRLRSAAANSVIAFQADSGGDLGRDDWSVLAQGICEEVTEPRRVEALRDLALPAWSCADDVFLRLRLTRLSGERVSWSGSDAT